jgi:hypothetical protein
MKAFLNPEYLAAYATMCIGTAIIAEFTGRSFVKAVLWAALVSLAVAIFLLFAPAKKPWHRLAVIGGTMLAMIAAGIVVGAVDEFRCTTFGTACEETK